MSIKLNSDSSLSEKQNKLKEAKYIFFKFKESLKKKEKNENEKTYIINKDTIEYLSKKLNIDFDKISEEEITYKKEIKNKETVDSKKIKLISDAEEIENDKFEIVNEKFLLLLGVDEKFLKNKDIIFNIISDKKQQILFKNGGTILNIFIKKNKKILHFIEGPTIEKNNNNDKINGNNDNNEDIKNIDNNEDIKNIDNNEDIKNN